MYEENEIRHNATDGRVATRDKHRFRKRKAASIKGIVEDGRKVVSSLLVSNVVTRSQDVITA